MLAIENYDNYFIVFCDFSLKLELCFLHISLIIYISMEYVILLIKLLSSNNNINILHKNLVVKLSCKET